MNAPANLKYSETHQWLRSEPDGSFTVGITDYAQELLGDLIFVESPKIGRKLKKNEQCGVVESVKSASDIYSPVAGEVAAVNASLETAPEKINQNAYEAWIFRLASVEKSEIDELLDAAAYQALTGN
ncbi:MAG TPA: glycine cleavage system protein GcvH [Burkholderiales bacterium]|nr:glycine cleavage system protein GcvH [Burkholderiales bacterium]